MTVIVKILFRCPVGGRVKSVFLIYAASEISFFLSLIEFFSRCSQSLSLLVEIYAEVCHPVNFVRRSGGRQNVHHFYVDIVN